MYVTGPMEVETSGGSICLTHVANTLRAATETARSQLGLRRIHPIRSILFDYQALATFFQHGDIVVFLPRNIMATIDATVDNGGAQRIEADRLSVESADSARGFVARLRALNGGGRC